MSERDFQICRYPQRAITKVDARHAQPFRQCQPNARPNPVSPHHRYHLCCRETLADLMRHGPVSLSDLAAATKVDQRALERLLTARITIGICLRTEDQRYLLAEIGAALDSEAPYSFKNWAIFEGEMPLKAWGGMLESIKSGKTAAELLGFDSSFDMMASSPEKIDIFNAAMADLTRSVTPAVVAAVDFSRFKHLMDVGGGTRELLGAIARKNPALRGTVFDLPRCAEAAVAHLERTGVKDRVSFAAGDFFRSVPAGADAIILKSVIHDWDDARSETFWEIAGRLLRQMVRYCWSNGLCRKRQRWMLNTGHTL
jgi:hypothetical protein